MLVSIKPGYLGYLGYLGDFQSIEAAHHSENFGGCFSKCRLSQLLSFKAYGVYMGVSIKPGYLGYLGYLGDFQSIELWLEI